MSKPKDAWLSAESKPSRLRRELFCIGLIFIALITACARITPEEAEKDPGVQYAKALTEYYESSALDCVSSPVEVPAGRVSPPTQIEGDGAMVNVRLTDVEEDVNGPVVQYWSSVVSLGKAWEGEGGDEVAEILNNLKATLSFGETTPLGCQTVKLLTKDTNGVAASNVTSAAPLTSLESMGMQYPGADVEIVPSDQDPSDGSLSFTVAIRPRHPLNDALKSLSEAVEYIYFP